MFREVISQTKKKGSCCLVFLRVYLRLLRTRAAATTIAMITTAAMAMYNVIGGASLLGGGAVVPEGDGDTDGDADAAVTPSCVSAVELQ